MSQLSTRRSTSMVKASLLRPASEVPNTSLLACWCRSASRFTVVVTW